MLERLVKAYKSILQRVGDPLEDGTLYGPLHTKQSVQAYISTLEVALPPLWAPPHQTVRAGLLYSVYQHTRGLLHLVKCLLS